MTARDIAQSFAIVTPEADAMEVAQLVAEKHLPGLIVCGDDGWPFAVLSDSQVLRFVLPGPQVLRLLSPTSVPDYPALARALDDQAADALCFKLVRTTLRDLLPRPQDVDELPVVDADATSREVAAVMARMHSPVVAVVDGNQVVGAITVSRLLDYVLLSCQAS